MLTDEQKKNFFRELIETTAPQDFGFPDFTDLYLPTHCPENGIYFPGPVALPSEMSFLAEELVKAAKHKMSQGNTTDFRVMSHGIPFRGTMMPASSSILTIFRRLPSEVWNLDDCGIKGRIADYILDERLSKGGLIIVSGMPGQGKSTTCAAVIVDRLKKHGGLCITVEDPIEMPLEGFHGNGVCFQRNMLGEQDFHVAVRDTMRAYPTQANSIMLIGEVRDKETAALALRSAVDGRLVVLTVHASTIVTTILRILSFAAQAIGESEARALLASSLRLVMNQKIVSEKTESGTRKRLKVSTLFDTNAVQGIIMTPGASIENLKNEIQSQMNKLRMGMEIKLRNLEE